MIGRSVCEACGQGSCCLNALGRVSRLCDEFTGRTLARRYDAWLPRDLWSDVQCCLDVVFVGLSGSELRLFLVVWKLLLHLWNVLEHAVICACVGD